MELGVRHGLGPPLQHNSSVVGRKASQVQKGRPRVGAGLTCRTGAADTGGVAAWGRGLTAGAASHGWYRLITAIEVPEGDAGIKNVEDWDF